MATLSPKLSGKGLLITGVTLTSPVPEPGTLALLGIGLLGVGFARRRREQLCK